MTGARRIASFVLATCLLACTGYAAIADRTFGDLRWRLLGPFRGGWATAGAGVPGDPTTFYLGAAGGGVWKTTDAGVTWRALEGTSPSIGAIAVAPSDPNVLWVGTGHIQQRWDILEGDGMYRSTDGGASFRHVGLEKSGHIGQIWVDPRDASVAVVTALGHLFGANEERGVFRTEDGGSTWKRVLYRDADTGAAHLAGDPAVPDVVFASLWQARRHPWMDYFQPNEGPGSGIYKSTDGGRTWAPAGIAGLPPGPKGRITLAVASSTAARRVWAGVAASEGKGVYRSDDGGTSWTLVDGDGSLVSDYTSGLTADPKDPDVLWAVGRSLQRSGDGGKSFTVVKGSPGGDDYHHLWIDPRDARRMIVSADQGAAVSLNGGTTWSSWYNQPTGQFYRLAADSRFPYRIYSGQQDNGTVAIASRSDYGQLTYRDWSPVGGDERDGDVPDPANPDVVYGAGLGGRLSKWDARTGQVQNVSPWPVVSYGARPTTVRYRYSWITPLAISPRPPHPIYQGAQVLFRSVDGGRNWETNSPDLTGTGAGEGSNDCDGDVPVEKATACGFGVIFAIAPSPAVDGAVWVGTDNGRVQLTRDDGKTWSDVTPPSMADWTKVNTIDAAPADLDTAYVAGDRHRLDDRRPLAFRTHDAGRTWTEIGHGLPDGAWVGSLRQDPKRAGLLYAGTYVGVFVSFDDGDSWQSLRLNFPAAVITDLLVHDDDLIAATQGRALWSLDGLAPLRHAPEAAAGSGPFLVPPPAAVRLRANNNKDTPLPPDEPRASNPPVGAVIDYVLDGQPKGPLAIEIADAGGRALRRFASDETPERRPAEVYFAGIWGGVPAPPTAHPGHNRFVWNLRLSPPRVLEGEYSIAAVPGTPTPVNPAGAFVLPGRYEVRLTVDGVTRRQPLEIVNDPRIETSSEDLAALLSLQAEVEAALARSADLAEEVGKAKERPAGLAENETPRAIHGALTSLATDLEGADAAPTGPQRQLLGWALEALDRFEAAWKKRR
jgi:photosystem II stability/assembly factor-like uncharacterized protein